MSDLKEGFDALRVRIEAMQQEMKEAAEKMVAEGTKAIFEEYGDIVWGFGWVQYTPWFNDGDACVFGMHDLSVFGREDLEDAPSPEEDDGYQFDEWLSENDYWYGGTDSFNYYRGKSTPTIGYGKDEKPNPDADQRYIDAKNACLAVYKTLEYNDFSKEIFGDHVKLLFTKKGVQVEEYSHD